jgi:hypothetical protein
MPDLFWHFLFNKSMKTTLPIEIFSIEDDGYHLKIKIVVNGKSANMILDTGASRTVFDEERIAHFVEVGDVEEHDRLSTGLGTNSMESKQVTLGELHIGGLKIIDYNAAVLDLTHVNQSYERLKIEPIDGVLGSDILFDYGAVIDYEKNELLLTIL